MNCENRRDGTADASPTAAPGEIASLPSLAADIGAALASLRVVGPDEYRLREEIDRGGMGRIVLAEDRRHGRDVAIKLLLADSGAAARRFVREAQIAARLSHPAIIPVYEIGRFAGGQPFIAMKRVDGQRLDEAIDAAPSLADRLALLGRVVPAIQALAYAHARGVIPRHLK